MLSFINFWLFLNWEKLIIKIIFYKNSNILIKFANQRTHNLLIWSRFFRRILFGSCRIFLRSCYSGSLNFNIEIYYYRECPPQFRSYCWKLPRRLLYLLLSILDWFGFLDDHEIYKIWTCLKKSVYRYGSAHIFLLMLQSCCSNPFEGRFFAVG